MNLSAPLNGSDQLMRTFDYELRRHGFAGNQCQIILELDGKLSPETLKARAAALQREFPILGARIGKILRPKWKIPTTARKEILVSVHRDEPNLRQKLFNAPLDIKRGELMRFDLIDRDGGKSDLIFTWSHLLMDATAAEHFLTAVSDENIVLPKANPQPVGAPKKWPARLELMKKSVEQLDKFCEQQPRALKTRFPNAPRELDYQVLKFSAEETKQVRANGVKICGVLGDAQFHAVIAAMELHRLHQKNGAATKSYILPMPVGLRAKGHVEPVFSNQVDMLMLQFLPEHLEATASAATALKAQALKAVKENSISYGRKLAELFSFLPLPIFMRVLKHGLKGEICSLFFGDTANVNPKLENFLGVRVNNFTHVAAVTPSPGLGVIFYYFRGELRVSIVHAKTILNETEAAEFSAALRHRLLQPIL
ncbi:MAG TPA: hypothetical protein VK742_17670 [Candidatus Sulfotelmatobacter sp.]|jgi:hypothetical protein|nr:hypothetical protein [Candidatus Sulfotelmatobacter sp.]